MKQYRIRTSGGWSAWRGLDSPLKGFKDLFTIQFNEPLTFDEAKEFFKHFEVE